MSRIKLPPGRKLATAFGTFSVALGIGFVMQNGDALAARFGEGPRAGNPAAALPQAAPSAPAVEVIVEGEAPVEATEAAVVTMAVEPAPAATEPADLVETAVVTMSAEPPEPEITPEAERPVEVAALAPAPAPVPERPAPVERPIALPEVPMDDAGGPAPRMSLQDRAALLERAAATPEPQLERPAPTEDVAAAPNCEAVMTAEAAANGMAVLTLAAPCAPSRAVTIHHEGMVFTLLTDDQGGASVSVPALAVDAMFVADLGDGQGAAAMVTLPDVAGLDRAVLQWQGGDGLNLHAFEFGAGFGEPGHVWQEAVGDFAAAAAGAGGFLTMLGDASMEGARLAEVYTYPSATGTRTGAVELTVEAEVAEFNCGQPLQAQAIQVSPGGDAFSFDLNMTMPGCDAVGQYLVVPEMLLDLALARP